MLRIQQLEHLVDVIEHRGSIVRPHLRPGLLRSEIEAALAPLGLTPPLEILMLYQWHDGIDMVQTRGTVQLFGDHTFLPLTDAVSTYHELIHYYATPPSALALTRCFPFAGHDASCQALYCSDIPFNGLLYPIIGIFYDISIAYESLEAMVKTAMEWFINGVYDSSPVNEVQKRSIWQHLNPHVPSQNTTL